MSAFTRRSFLGKAAAAVGSFAALQKAAELDAFNVLAHLRLGQLLASANAPEPARQHLALVLEQQPRNAEAHAVMGTVYISTGAIGKAEQEFQAALSLQPDHQAPAVALAELYSTMGDIERARQVLLRAADANRHEALAFLALGRPQQCRRCSRPRPPSPAREAGSGQARCRPPAAPSRAGCASGPRR